MKKLTWVLLVVVMPCFSQANETQQTVGGKIEQTVGQLNGRFWQGMPPGPIKTAFIVGFGEGIGFARPQAKDFPSVPYGDIVKGLDRFYQEPENLIFPIGYALEVFTMKVEGATQSDIEKKLMEYRTFIRTLEEALKRSRQ
jgi:hypothetical protein